MFICYRCKRSFKSRRSVGVHKRNSRYNEDLCPDNRTEQERYLDRKAIELACRPGVSMSSLCEGTTPSKTTVIIHSYTPLW